MDQSELEANTCNRCQARENVSELGTVVFVFVSYWLRKVARVLLTNHRAQLRKTKANELLSALNLKSPY